jgi:hypothetical protein
MRRIVCSLATLVPPVHPSWPRAGRSPGAPGPNEAFRVMMQRGGQLDKRVVEAPMA